MFVGLSILGKFRKRMRLWDKPEYRVDTQARVMQASKFDGSSPLTTLKDSCVKLAVRSTQIALALAIGSLPLAICAQDATSNQQTIHHPLTLEAAVQQAADRYPAIRAAE